MPVETGPDSPGPVNPLLAELISTLEPNPAYVMDRCWDLLAYNRAYEGPVGGLGQLADNERNGILLLFTRPSMRTLLGDWNGEAQQLVGQFRAFNGARMDVARVRHLVEGLRGASTEFAALWDRHQIRAFSSSRKTFHHPQLGLLTMNYVKLAAVDDPAQHLVSFLPADPATAEALPRLGTTIDPPLGDRQPSPVLAEGGKPPPPRPPRPAPPARRRATRTTTPDSGQTHVVDNQARDPLTRLAQISPHLRTATGAVYSHDPPPTPACPTNSPAPTTARQPDHPPHGDRSLSQAPSRE